MQTRPLGRTGLMVTEVAFGGIPIQRLEDQEAADVVRHCLEVGVNFVDTAHAYGTSERRIGMAIADRPLVNGRREGVILATKSGSRDGATVQAELEQSFQALAVDYIDLYQFHNVSKADEYEKVLAPGGPLERVQQARDAGRIGHIGVTSHNLEMALKMVPSGHFETLMFPFNYVTDEPAQELIPLCAKHGVGFIAMKPMGGGMLADAALSFKWLRQRPDVVPVVGIEKAEEIDEIVALYAANKALNAGELEAIRRMREELGTRFCRRCGYCQPCPQEIDITTVMNLRSFGKRFPPERMFGEWGAKIVEQAENCEECGACESRCPYELPIRQVIKENIAWFRAEEARFRG